MKSLSTLFKTANIVASFGWAILIFLPNWDLADSTIKYGIVAFLSIFYLYLIFVRKDIHGKNYPKGNLTSLRGILELFQNPRNLLAGWAHYLAFDLMLGIYIKHQANEIGMSHALQIPCFLLTFILGPAGYLLFVILEICIK